MFVKIFGGGFLGGKAFGVSEPIGKGFLDQHHWAFWPPGREFFNFVGLGSLEGEKMDSGAYFVVSGLRGVPAAANNRGNYFRSLHHHPSKSALRVYALSPGP